MTTQYRLGTITENTVVPATTGHSPILQVKFHLSKPYTVGDQEIPDIWASFSLEYPERLQSLLDVIGLPKLVEFPSEKILGKTCCLEIQPEQYKEAVYSRVTEFYKTDPLVDKFLDELEELYRKYNLCLAHQDHQGAFIIEKLSEDRIQWVRAAHRRV